VTNFLRHVLERVINRPRFNDSCLYGAYLNLRYPSYVQLKKAERVFYGDAIGKHYKGLIFDIGANGGAKTIIFLDLAAKVISVEPSPLAAHILRQRFSKKPQVHIVQKGISSKEGVARFYMFDDTDAYNTFSQIWVDALSGDQAPDGRPSKIVKKAIDIPVTTLDQLITEFGRPDYVKIDVEGYEAAVIKGLSKNVPLLSFECNLPEFAEDTAEIVRGLSLLDPMVRFNFVVTEPPVKFESAEWLDTQNMLAVLGSSDIRYMEIYCRSGDRGAAQLNWDFKRPEVNAISPETTTTSFSLRVYQR